MTNSSGVSGRWYLAALIPFAIGAGVVAGSAHSLVDDVERMPRVVVPGSGEVTLAAGDYTAFGESESHVGDTVYRASSLQVRCALRAVGGPEQVALTTPSGKVSYGFAGFQGRSMFALTIPRAGTYQLLCEGDGGPATVAFGQGIGTSIVLALLGGFGGIGGAIATLLVVRRKRRRARAAQELGGLPTATVV